MEYIKPRPTDQKKPKSIKQKNKELRAKKRGNKYDIPRIVESWMDIYDSEQYYECDFWWTYYDDVPACLHCHRCTNTTPISYVVGQDLEYVINY